MQKVIFILSLLVIVSCNLFKPASKIVYKQNNKLETYWEILTKDWEMKNDILEGNGENMNWGVLLLKNDLPDNYEIELDANMVDESLFELMLNIDDDKYVRVYLYEIEQSAKLGRGEFANVSTGRPGGGPTIESVSIELKNNIWYHMKVRCYNNHLVFNLNDKKLFEHSLTKENLSTSGRLGLLTNGKVLIKNLIIKQL